MERKSASDEAIRRELHGAVGRGQEIDWQGFVRKQTSVVGCRGPVVGALLREVSEIKQRRGQLTVEARPQAIEPNGKFAGNIALVEPRVE